MARPAETSLLRRVLMPTIMWIILGSTLGLAALVDLRVAARTTEKLGGPTQIDNVRLQLPAGWEQTDDDKTDALLEMREPINDATARILAVNIGPRNFAQESLESRGLRPPSLVKLEPNVPMGTATGTLRVYQQAVAHWSGQVFYQTTMDLTCPLARSRQLTIRLIRNGDRGVEMHHDIDLVKRIGATVISGE